MTILSVKWTVTTFIFFMLKETTSESTISIKMNEATTTNTESKLKKLKIFVFSSITHNIALL